MNIKPVPYSVARRQFATSNPTEKAAFVQPLYDRLTYDKAGQTQLSFFATQVGQGGKTFEDTNLTLAGQLPKGQEFLGLALEFDVIPNQKNVVASTADPALAQNYINDVAAIINSGWVEINILDKNWLRDAPISKFPPASRLVANGALALDKSTAANSLQIQVAAAGGSQYLLSGLWLDSSTSFNVTLNWGTAVALPSNLDAKVRCTLKGINYRNVA